MAIEVTSLICPGCGCLCDDLVARVQDGQLLEVANVCRWGAAKLFGDKRFKRQQPRKRWPRPQLRLRGRWEEVGYDAALDRAGELLTVARRPLVFGLTCLGSWAQAAALKLARRLQARLEPADLALLAPYYQAVQEHGLYATTLEVIRDQVDTVVFWGANPLHSCPRQVVRYAVFARGRFLERGVEDRRVAVVDLQPTELKEFAHLFLKTDPTRELKLIEEIIQACTDAASPVSSSARKLAEFLKAAAYGAIFVGRGVTYGAAGALWAALIRLTAVLNRERPFVILPLASDFNSCGWYQLALRELGHPWAPDFGLGPEVFAREPGRWEEVDAVLVAGGDPFWFLTDGAGRRPTPAAGPRWWLSVPLPIGAAASPR